MKRRNRISAWQQAAHRYLRAQEPEPPIKGYANTKLGRQIDQIEKFVWSHEGRIAHQLVLFSKRVITLGMVEKERLLKTYGWGAEGFLVATRLLKENPDHIPYVKKIDLCDAVDALITSGLSPKRIIERFRAEIEEIAREAPSLKK